MRIAIRNHQNKSRGLANALVKAGHTLTGDNPDIFLIDHDSPEYYRNIIDQCDARVILYPHGALAHFAWNGLWEVNPRTRAFWAMSWGQAENMRAYGYPNPIYVTGWHWCEQKPYHWRDPQRILFAPVHPLGNGWLWSEVARRNAETFDDLLKTGCDITVRHVGPLEANGLWKVGGVQYQSAGMDNGHQAIDTADLVVSFGTFAYLAVARGVPCVMYCQDVPLWDGRSEDTVKFVNNWERFAPLVEYPFDLRWYRIGDKMDEGELDYWRKRYIGEQITPERVNQCLSTPI